MLLHRHPETMPRGKASKTLMCAVRQVFGLFLDALMGEISIWQQDAKGYCDSWLVCCSARMVAVLVQAQEKRVCVLVSKMQP
jgi:hypothetical protein